MAKTKVAFIINNLGMGGAENMLMEQIRAIDKGKFEPFLVTIMPNPKVTVLNKIPPGVMHLESLSTYRLWKFLRDGKIHAVVTSLFDANLYGRIAAVLARVPVILSTEVNVYADKKVWQITADRILAKFTKRILVSSNEVLNFTMKQEGLSEDKFQLNFNAIPLKLGDIKKTRNQILKKFTLPEGVIYIATAGSLTPQKGQFILLDAVKTLKGWGVRNFKVLIFGRGVLKEELEAHIDSLGIREEVQFMGIAPIEQIMAIADIFTLPSLWEGLSIALLEAMDAKCPIVATRISGTSEALENEVSALIVNPGNASELAGALKRVIVDGQLRERLAEGAYRAVERFSIDKNVKVIENLILHG